MVATASAGAAIGMAKHCTLHVDAAAAAGEGFDGGGGGGSGAVAGAARMDTTGSGGIWGEGAATSRTASSSRRKARRATLRAPSRSLYGNSIPRSQKR